MKRLVYFFFGILFYHFSNGQNTNSAVVNLPVPNHIVVVFMENYSLSQIIGDTNAPYINALAADPNSALFIHSFALSWVSQPNYIHFFSGCNQGVTGNLNPPNDPFITDNLGRQLLDSGKTFITYSEDLPYAGYNDDTDSSGNYVRKHNPVTNWMGTGINQLPDTVVNQPYSNFPTSNFSLLPTVSFVIPNVHNDMHDGQHPQRITVGDSWLNTNLSGYIQWAKSNNSLFILTFDEGGVDSNVTTIFTGAMVQGGVYTDSINHHTVLRTIEDMYNLPYACDAVLENPITTCWVTQSINENQILKGYLNVKPNPANKSISVSLPVEFYNNNIQPKNNFEIKLIDFMGREISQEHFSFSQTQAEIKIDVVSINKGVYFLLLSNNKKRYKAKFVKM